MRWGQAASAAIVALALLAAGITVATRAFKGDAEPVNAAASQEALLVASAGTAGLDAAQPAQPSPSLVVAPPQQVPPPPPTATPEPTATPLPPAPAPTSTPLPPAPAATPLIEQVAPPTPTPVPPTPTPVPPTATPVPPTATPLPPTPSATPTPRPPTATPTFTPRPVQAFVAPPTATATATRTPLPFVAGSVTGKATPYADSLAGNSMGCTGAGPYNPNDITVVAVSAFQHNMFPCGTKLEICGPQGCITGYRKDSCPGCGNGDVDLSRAGFRTVCGIVNSCAVRTRSVP